MKVLEDDNYHSQRLDLIYEPKAGIYVISFLCAITFAYSYYNPIEKFSAVIWLSTFVLYIALRIFMGLYYWDSRKTKHYNYKKFDNLNFYITSLGGIIWGISTYLFLLRQPSHNLLIGIMIYAGVCAGGMISNSASLKANLSFIYTILLTSMVSFFFYNQPEKYSIVTLMALFSIGCTYCAIIINKLVLNNLKLSYKNQQLLDEVKESNSKQIIIERQALQSSKMATIGEMASGMAHEINNPLAIIKGNLNLLKRHLKLDNVDSTDEFYDKSINKCLENINRIVEVISSLKKMSQLSFDNPILSISVKEILNDSIGFINEKLKCSNIRLIRDSINEDVIIQCDSITTSQILLGIISYAFGVCSKRNHSWIKIRTLVVEDYIHFEVYFSEYDHNFPILKQSLSNISNSNSHDTDTKKLQAYDLSLNQSLANKMGGNITADDETPQCLRFTIPKSGLKSKDFKSAA